MTAEPAPFSHIVAVRDVPASGRHYRLEATAAERARLAADFAIPSVEALAAELALKPVGDTGFRLSGHFEASVVQTDVVTLEPVTQSVTGEIATTLLPAEDTAHAASGETEVDVSGEEDFDVYRRGRIDLGAIVAEHLALLLDPYPRAPDVEFPGHAEGDDETPSPFAALAALKPRED